MADARNQPLSDPSPTALWIGSIILGWLIDVFIPLPFVPLRFAPIAAGSVFLLIGFGIVALALHEMRDYNAPTDLGEAIPTLVTGGVFRVSRNPMYLGLHVALIGAAIALDSLWILATLIPFHLILAKRIVPHEERELERIYGELYGEYMSDVRRWL